LSARDCRSCQPEPVEGGIAEDVSLSLSKMSAWACRRPVSACSTWQFV